jgi:ABC-type uncharacterized transport system, permease component
MEEKSLPPCDLVMKGGITSGIVYPPAIVQLKDSYTFHSIGGTSAGAIAAAAAAAAEYNRQGGGFAALEQVGQSLGEQGTLLHLFQATPKTQFLLDILLAILQLQQEKPTATSSQEQAAHPPSQLQNLRTISKRLNALWLKERPTYARAGNIGRWSGIGVGIVLALIMTCAFIGLFSLLPLMAQESTRWIEIGLALILLCLGSWLGGFCGQWLGRGWHVLSATLQLWETGLQDTFYGICPGHTPVPDEQNATTALTDWLSAVIDRIAGLAPEMTNEQNNQEGNQGKYTSQATSRRIPLTFGALQQHGVNLQMVTSNLNHSQPYILPGDLHNFIFKERDMQRLFPAYIVEQLKTPPKQPLFPLHWLPAGYHFLPAEEDLPVIFGVRLSLSFPLLLSAVPLYTLSTTAYQAYIDKTLAAPFDAERHLQCNWFSDGGICSNFPIQFFDHWLPAHPTFGVNLASTKLDASVLQPAAAHADPTYARSRPYRKAQPYTATSPDSDDVYLPLAEGAMDTEWSPVASIPAFLLAIFGTTQNYRDTLQMRLPSYRERVAQIRLAPNEGGLSLTMLPTTIQHVEQKGAQAGTLLRTFQFEHHWWVRFLVLMARLEENLQEMREIYDEGDLLDITQPSQFRIRLQREWNSAHDPQQRYPYYRDRQWCEEALRRVQALKIVIDTWQKTDENDDRRKQANTERFFQTGAPTPETVLRVTPPV